ncbi:DUF5606 domain-containing protein [Bacteroidota bacterium]
MELSKILSISGKPGLYKMIAETKTGAIVESIIDNKRFPAFASERISSLEEISIYTSGEDLPLKDIFKAIHDKESGGKAVDHKSDDKVLKEYMKSVVPDYDEDKVYASDIRKIMLWYNILHDNSLLDFTEEEKEEDTESKVEKKEETKVKDKVKEIDSEKKGSVVKEKTAEKKKEVKGDTGGENKKKK